MAGIGVWVVIGLVYLAVLSYYVPIRWTVAAARSGLKIRLRDLIGMRLRKVSPGVIVPALMAAHKAGLSLSPGQLEAHYLAGGNVQQVIHALISADQTNLHLSFEQAAMRDLGAHRGA